MSDSSSSGNRWEPTSADPGTGTSTGTGTGTTAVAEHPAPVPSYDGAAPAAPYVPAGTPRRSLRERLAGVPRAAVAAGVAAFLIVAAGFGGFAIGRATAPDSPGQQTGFTPGDRGGFPGGPGQDGDGGPQGFTGQQGQQGQQGTFPGQQQGGTTGSNA